PKGTILGLIFKSNVFSSYYLDFFSLLAYSEEYTLVSFLDLESIVEAENDVAENINCGSFVPSEDGHGVDILPIFFFKKIKEYKPVQFFFPTLVFLERKTKKSTFYFTYFMLPIDRHIIYCHNAITVTTATHVVTSTSCDSSISTLPIDALHKRCFCSCLMDLLLLEIDRKRGPNLKITEKY
ncbi:hypothetical protein ACJX0J_026205, partial [Zea mays]